MSSSQLSVYITISDLALTCIWLALIMLSNCFHCNKIASSDTITCTFCNNIIHILCLYDAKIIDVQVAHNNKTKAPPNYAKSIFNSVNFLFKCPNCISAVPINKNASNESLILPQLTSINDKLDNIKKLIETTTHDSNNNNMKLSYADSLKSISNLSTQLKSSLETNIN